MTQLSTFDLLPFSNLTQKPKNRRKREWHKFDTSYGHPVDTFISLNFVAQIWTKFQQKVNFLTSINDR